MKLKQPIYIARQSVRGGTTLFCLLAVAQALRAQEQVLAPPPAYSVTPPAMQDYETNQPGALQLQSLASGVGTPPPWTQFGPLTVHPHLLFRFLYGNGIQSEPGQSQNTAIEQFSPGVLFAFGSHWTLDYTPLFSFYSSSSFENTIDQNVILTWGASYQDWVLGFSQGYIASSDPLVQTGTQTTTESYSTSAKASYHFSGRMSVDLLVGQNFSFADQFTSTRSWSTMDWLNYDTGEKWDVGIGAGYEYNNVSPGPNAMDELVQARVRWRTTDKISLSVHGGVEVQQYLGTGASASSLVTPVFGASIQYHPFDTTTLSLVGDRSVAPSLFEGQVAQSTTVALTLSQRLLKQLSLSVSGTYGETSYLASTNSPTTSATRVDDFYSFTARLSTTFFERGTAAIFYQYSDNISTLPGFGFAGNQTGVELGYRF